jgi:hypothetical protein
VAGPYQVGGDRRTHVAKTDKANFHGGPESERGGGELKRVTRRFATRCVN